MLQFPPSSFFSSLSLSLYPRPIPYSSLDHDQRFYVTPHDGFVQWQFRRGQPHDRMNSENKKHQRYQTSTANTFMRIGVVTCLLTSSIVLGLVSITLYKRGCAGSERQFIDLIFHLLYFLTIIIMYWKLIGIHVDCHIRTYFVVKKYRMVVFFSMLPLNLSYTRSRHRRRYSSFVSFVSFVVVVVLVFHAHAWW
jgi:uncharacterized membrane protein YwzB